jgi:hypothetical protein
MTILNYWRKENMNENKYISFIERPAMTKTKVFEVINRQYGDLLGHVRWYGPWHKYCFIIDIPGLVFDSGCLADIQDFIDKLMAEWKNEN